MKRQNVITWDQYFMGMAHLSALRSKDPSTQVGAVIVSPANKVVSIGYNGLPKGCSDDEYPWERDTTDEAPRVGVFICHCGQNIASVIDVQEVARST